MKEDKNIPELRFPEFVDGWKKTTIKNVFNIFNGYAFKSSDSKDYGCRWIKIADVGINRINNDTKSFLPQHFLQKHKKFLLTDGDYIVALTRPILGGKLKIAKIDGDTNGSLLNQRVGKLITKNNVEFVFQTLQQRALIAKIENRIAGSDPPNLSPYEINSLKIHIPSLPEQTKIANFLTTVDERINLLTQQQEKLEHYKKGLMQQIFSQQLRFKDDNGKAFPEWEEKKVMDVFQVTRGYVLAVTKMKPESDNKYRFPVYSSQTKNNGLTGYYDTSLYENAITWTTDGANAGDVKYRAGKFYCTNVCGVLISSDGHANECIAAMLNAVTHKHVSYVGNPKLMNGVMGNIKISFPSVSEQQKIAAFLSSIDQKIELVSSQIEHTKSWKKGLLQQMFV